MRERHRRDGARAKSTSTLSVTSDDFIGLIRDAVDSNRERDRFERSELTYNCREFGVISRR